MRLTLDFRRRALASVAVCVLLALAAYSQLTEDPAEQETHCIVVANMDRSVKPSDDFYHYANGGWIKRSKLPPDRARIW
jgi:putative endopeptidase